MRTILIIITIASLGGAGIYFSSTLPQEQALKESKKDTEQIKSNPNESTCSQHTECIAQYDCITELAKTTKDISVCSTPVQSCEGVEVFTEVLASFAQESCIQEVELEKVKGISAIGDYNQCLQLQGIVQWFGNNALKKDICLLQVAIKTQTPLACTYIENGSLVDSLGFTLQENCYNFSTHQGEASQDLENPFREFFDLFPAQSETQTCIQKALGQNFFPAYEGTYRKEKEILEALEACLEPKNGESNDHLTVRLLPSTQSCMKEVLGEKNFAAFFNEPSSTLNPEQLEQFEQCPIIQEIQKIGPRLEKYLQ